MTVSALISARRFFVLLTVVVSVAVIPVKAQEPASGDSAKTKSDAQQARFFQQKVLPLLQSRCFECHDFSEDREAVDELGGSLLLSSRKAMLVGGDTGPAIVPGNAADSLMIQAVHYDGYEMPPRSKMPEAEIRILEEWVNSGAYFPDDLENAVEFHVEDFPLEQRAAEHWAWHFDPDAVTVPSVRNAEWPLTDIDRFVLRKLEDNDLTPSADTDRATLIRRLSYDLTGLPPSIEDVRAFVDDKRSTTEAVTGVVDRLLDSPAFGEHWARHWLDLVRYADTLGHEFDYPLPDAWKYRDYVIRALNEDVAYDQFIKEHVAGDLLQVPRRHPGEGYNESVIGTGFWFLHENKHAPVDVRGEEAAVIDNQIDVFSKTFLGMTLACARCHDHKFDAISTADYYAMAGFLQSSHRTSAWLDPGQRIEQQLNELTEVRRSALKLLDQSKPDDAARYLLAAAQALNLSLPVTEGFDRAVAESVDSKESGSSESVTFADFEADTFTTNQGHGWKIEGDAFPNGPVAGKGGPAQNISGLQGQKAVNSYLGTDKLKGKLTSPSFTISQPVIRFLIGGGSAKEKVGINLRVDSKVVRTASGERSDQLKPVSWDVTEFRGQTAVLEIFDQSKGGWGHVVVDEIRFEAVEDGLPLERKLTPLAKHHGLDRGRLGQWVRRLHSSDSDDDPMSINHAFRFARQLASTDFAADTAIDAELIASQVNRFAEALAERQQLHEEVSQQVTVLADFSNGIPEDWRTSGNAFGDVEDSLCVTWKKQRPQIQAFGVSSASLSVKQRGSLYSPTFTIDGDAICVQVAGQSAGLRLVVDGYIMHEFTPLLFKGTKVDVNTDGEFRWLILSGDLDRYKGHRAYLEVRDDNDGWFAVRQVLMPHGISAEMAQHRLSDFELQQLKESAERLESLQRSRVGLMEVLKTLIPISPVFHRERATWQLESQELVKHWSSEAGKVPSPMRVMAMMDGTPENERIFIRGSHRSLGDVVPRNILTALQKPSEADTATSDGERSGRLQLAEKLVSGNNPLTSRVAVNRIWHHLFGRGIVQSTDNFGVLGAKPTHPELLNYLAVRFMDQDWSLKSIIREIVRSRTYRMDSRRTAAADLDPTNQWLHRFPIRRLSAEAVRDSMLAVSGELNRQLYGAPVPIRLSSFMQGRGRPGQNGPLDGGGRRSLYLKINRNFLSPMMTAFDSPTPFTTIGRRTVSNVPAQALILLNNEFVIEMAARWAKHLQAQHTTLSEQLRVAWFQLYSVEPSADDLQPLLDYVDDVEGRPEQILKELCHVLLNGKQFIYLK